MKDWHNYYTTREQGGHGFFTRTGDDACGNTGTLENTSPIHGDYYDDSTPPKIWD